MRVILFTGKGGVGKTTIATATALRTASAGHKTLLMSTDPAHSIGDALGVELGPEPTEVATGLWAEQLDAQRRLEDNWSEIQEHVVAVLRWAGLHEIEAEELTVLPGLDELFALADVKRHHDSDPYDVLVVDCAPTGETLRLLSLPDVIRWYMERVFPVERRVVGALRPVAQRMTNFPLPTENVYSAVHRFYDKLDGVRQVLTDPAVTSVRLVVNPERMVIAEAQRTYTYLNLFGYRVDAVIANRLLPDAITDGYFARWKELQSEHMQTIHDAFAPVPILTAALRDDEVVGPMLLEQLGAEIYADTPPHDVLFEGDPISVERRGTDQVMTIALPFAEREALELSQKADELFLRVGPYRRTLLLPRSLAARELTSAKLAEGKIEIVFSKAST